MLSHLSHYVTFILTPKFLSSLEKNKTYFRPVVQFRRVTKKSSRKPSQPVCSYTHP